MGWVLVDFYVIQPEYCHDSERGITMYIPLVFAIFFYCINPLAAHAQPEPHIPLGAIWQMTLAQTEELSSLDRQTDESLKAAATIRSGAEIVLYATWKERTITFRIDRNFGLHAIGIELVPETIQHSPTADDAELRDLQYRAPMRIAVVNKYGKPHGISRLWDALDVNALQASVWKETHVTDWFYALSWLIWEGHETRIAVGEQEVWYVSQAWLEQRRQARALLERHALTAQDSDLVRQAERQQRLDQARAAVSARAEEFEPLL